MGHFENIEYFWQHSTYQSLSEAPTCPIFIFLKKPLRSRIRR